MEWYNVALVYQGIGQRLIFLSAHHSFAQAERSLPAYAKTPGIKRFLNDAMTGVITHTYLGYTIKVIPVRKDDDAYTNRSAYG